jgi:hypothetical protein
MSSPPEAAVFSTDFEGGGAIGGLGTAHAPPSEISDTGATAGWGGRGEDKPAPCAAFLRDAKCFVKRVCLTWRTRCDRPVACGAIATLAAIYTFSSVLMVRRSIVLLAWVVPEALILFLLSFVPEFNLSYGLVICYCTLLHLIPITETYFYPVSQSFWLRRRIVLYRENARNDRGLPLGELGDARCHSCLP